MIRTVVGTNVLVSSFLAGGKPRAVMDEWRFGRLTICLSREIVDEYAAVLLRLNVPETDVGEMLGLFATGFNCLFAGRTPALNVCRDPDDDKFISCAVALNAKVIVSGDRYLLDIGRYVDIDIMSPAEFLASFGNAE